LNARDALSVRLGLLAVGKILVVLRNYTAEKSSSRKTEVSTTITSLLQDLF
jgi:hypothetical protein